MEHATIDSLASAYRNGRAEALPPLVTGLARTLLAQAYRYVHDWDQAADLVQDTWLRVTEAIGRFDARRPFLPWVRTILRHCCLQYLAAQARRPEPVPLAALGDPATEKASDQPDIMTDRADLRRRLARHLAGLPDTQRQAVVMIDLEQLDHAEAALALDLTPASLRVILHRGRRALARRMELEETS